MFDALDIETDHLPVDIERKNWSAKALKRKDVEIAEAEAIHKNDVINVNLGLAFTCATALTCSIIKRK
jgi:hypothetical protein